MGWGGGTTYTKRMLYSHNIIVLFFYLYFYFDTIDPIRRRGQYIGNKYAGSWSLEFCNETYWDQITSLLAEQTVNL